MCKLNNTKNPFFIGAILSTLAFALVLVQACPSSTAPTGPTNTNGDGEPSTNLQTNTRPPNSISTNLAVGSEVFTVSGGCVCLDYTLNPANGTNNGTSLEILSNTGTVLTLRANATGAVFWTFTNISTASDQRKSAFVLADAYLHFLTSDISALIKPSTLIISNLSTNDDGGKIIVENSTFTESVTLTINLAGPPEYEITAGNSDGFFAINPTNGAVTVATSPITAGTYALTVAFYTNRGTPKDSFMTNIIVTN